MKFIGKGWNWFKQNAPIFNTILMVIIISQLITYFGIKLINDTIIPVAYLVSIFLLYITFKESQRGNLIESGKQIFEIYKEEIKIILKSLENPAFTVTFTFDNKTTKINPNCVSGIYSDINSVFGSIIRKTEYHQYLEKIKAKNSELLETNEILLRNFIDELTEVHNLLQGLNIEITDFVKIYERILSSKDSLTKDQIVLLTTELDKNLLDYTRFCKDKINNKGIFETEIILLITKCKYDKFNTIIKIDKYREFKKLTNDNFIINFNRISEIKDQLK